MPASSRRPELRRARAGAFVLCVLFACGQPSMAQLAADLSILPRAEHGGAIFYDQEGQPRDALDYLQQSGLRFVRLRLWHTPVEPWHGLDSTIAFAQRIRETGQQLLLDLHCSDTWADPANQRKPAAWQALHFAALTDSVYQYTASVLRRFQEAGATPAAVQIGNEITNGMLWDDGRVGGEFDTPQQWNQLAALVLSAIGGIHAALPPDEWPLIVLQLDRGGDNLTSRWWFDHLQERHVPFDVIGQSYYRWWQGSLNDLSENLTDLVSVYHKPVWVVETAYPFTLEGNDDEHNIVGDSAQLDTAYGATPDGQAAFIRDVMEIARAANQGVETPVFYWEPTWLANDSFGSPWENLACFDFAGHPLPVLELMHDAVGGQPRRAKADVALLVWPNPLHAGSVLFVSGSSGAPRELSLYNLLGRRVLMAPISGRGLQGIDTRSLAAGVYFLRANGAPTNSVATIRILR
ncbi:glycosyl hydrolase 53 family protein [candidate division KSB1 bacterium]|nr:glycosyl hydrolase 53 family protein [candidate division KSB1 bacterium]